MKVNIDAQEVFELAEWLDTDPTMFITFHKLRCLMKSSKVYGLHKSKFNTIERVLRMRKGTIQKFIEKLQPDSPAFYSNDLLGIPEVLVQFKELASRSKYFQFVNLFTNENLNQFTSEKVIYDHVQDPDQDPDQDQGVEKPVETTSQSHYSTWPPQIEAGDPLSKHLLKAYRYFEEPTNQPWTKKNAYLMLGRQPLKKHPNVWMHPRTLAEAFQLYEKLEIPQMHWHRAMETVKSQVESLMITVGSACYQKPDLYDGGEALKTWAKDKLVSSLTTTNKFSLVNGQANARKAEQQSNYYKTA